MILHNLDLSVETSDWTYPQKVMLHAVMCKMVLDIYCAERKRNVKNDYVKFAVDVLIDFADGTGRSEAEANIKIANWSLESYAKELDRWIENDPPCPNKDLYDMKASFITVIIGAFNVIPLLHREEAEEILYGFKTNFEHDYFTSEKVCRYCQLLFVEGLGILDKILNPKTIANPPADQEEEEEIE